LPLQRRSKSQLAHRPAARAAGRPVTAADLVPVLFRRELDLQQLFFAMGEAIAHLNHLWRAGRLARDRDANGILHFAAVP
jgi:hypothetical protein